MSEPYKDAMAILRAAQSLAYHKQGEAYDTLGYTTKVSILNLYWIATELLLAHEHPGYIVNSILPIEGFTDDDQITIMYNTAGIFDYMATQVDEDRKETIKLIGEDIRATAAKRELSK